MMFKSGVFDNPTGMFGGESENVAEVLERRKVIGD